MAARAILFIILSIVGATIAEAIQYNRFNQYACNFVYSAIIAIYILENWTLCTDLQIKTTENTELTKKNIELKRTQYCKYRATDPLVKKPKSLAYFRSQWDLHYNPQDRLTLAPSPKISFSSPHNKQY
jgi:hypothetical protein